VIGNIIELRPIGPLAPAGPDEWRLMITVDALFAILNDAHDLEHALQIVGEALVVVTEEEPA
jgi:hypothetical protein